MRTRRLSAAVLLVALGSCAAPRAPAPTPIPFAAPAPAPPPSAVGRDWRDWPPTPGDWRYGAVAGGSEARFGVVGAEPALRLVCDRAARTVTLALTGAGGTATVRTTSTQRALALAAAPPRGATATLAATDPLLDAMGFSRGRFVIERAALPPLVVPAWAEILRVTEDCRQ